MYKINMLLVLLLGVAMGIQAQANSLLIWDDRDGFAVPDRCMFGNMDDIPLRVSKFYSNQDEYQPHEPLRSESGSVQYYLPNSSIVWTDNILSNSRYKKVEVIAASQNADYPHNRFTAQRDFGSKRAKTQKSQQNLFILADALDPLDNYVFEINDDKNITHIPGTKYYLTGSYWQIAMKAGEYRAASCDYKGTTRVYYLFDVYSQEQEEVDPVSKIGVSTESSSIFDQVTGWNVKFLEAEAERLESEDDLGSDTSTNSSSGSNSSATTGPSTSSGSSGAKSQSGSGSQSGGKGQSDSSKANTTSSQSDLVLSKSERPKPTPDSVKAASAQYHKRPTENNDKPTADEELIGFDDGLYEHVACVSSSLQIRDSSLSRVLLSVQPLESIKPFQGWGENEKTQEINGETHTFRKVQLPNQGGRTGWVAKDFIKLKSQCEIYQESLGDDQEMVCTSGAPLRVRDESLQEVLFDAKQHEKVSRREDWQQSKKVSKIGGESHTMIPVFFVYEGREGWVSEEFISKKKDCESFQSSKSSGNPKTDPKQKVESLKSEACCFFPIKNEPETDYTRGTPSFGARRSGGRVHAASDLYQGVNDPIYAVAQGKVIRRANFYSGTWEVTVEHPGGFIVRYGEIAPQTVKGTEPGSSVEKGQMIAKTGRMNCCRPMLHFELFSGEGKGSLTRKGVGKYSRRSDIMNPTSYLQEWQKAAMGWSY